MTIEILALENDLLDANPRPSEASGEHIAAITALPVTVPGVPGKTGWYSLVELDPAKLSATR